MKTLSPPLTIIDANFPKDEAHLNSVAVELGQLEDYMQTHKHKVILTQDGFVKLTHNQHIALTKDGFRQLIQEFNQKNYQPSQASLLKEIHNLLTQQTLQSTNPPEEKILIDRVADTAIDSLTLEDQAKLMETLQQLSTTKGWQKLAPQIYKLESEELLFVLRVNDRRVIFTQTDEGYIMILDVFNYKRIKYLFPDYKGDV